MKAFLLACIVLLSATASQACDQGFGAFRGQCVGQFNDGYVQPFVGGYGVQQFAVPVYQQQFGFNQFGGGYGYGQQFLGLGGGYGSGLGLGLNFNFLNRGRGFRGRDFRDFRGPRGGGGRGRGNGNGNGRGRR